MRDDKTRELTTAKAGRNTGVLRCAQDDDVKLTTANGTTVPTTTASANSNYNSK
jgi:hypothetical protein